MINILQKEMQNLKNKIDGSDIVSFDIFDTLVLRDVIHPTDIFKCISIEYERVHSKSLTFDFYKERIEAEMEARIRSSSLEDITYDEIYNVLEEKYGDEVKILKKLELELESKFIVLNNFMFEIYRYALDSGKRVFLVSDMYLPKVFLESVMKKCGIIGYEALLVSNDMMKTKHHGTIYPWIIDEYSLDGSNWIHIGDNFQSDVVQANNNGVVGIYYKKVSQRANIEEVDKIEESIIKAIEINAEFTDVNLEYWDKFSIKYASKLYFALTYWLTKDIIENKKDNIYFMARDGYIVYHIYQKFQAHMKNLPSAKYLYASRRGFQYPETIDLERDEALHIILGWNPQFDQKLTMEEVFLNLSLNHENYSVLLDKYDLKINTIIRYEDNTYQNAKELLQEIWLDIQQVFTREKDLLEGYLEQEGISDYKTVNIFDVGWRGSIQKAIATVTNKKIYGYYFGTSQWPHPIVQQNSTSCFVNIGLPKDRMEHIFRHLMIYEHIFSAPHGSLINFKRDGDKIVPNLENIEDNENTSNVIEHMHVSADKMIDKYLEYISYMDILDPSFVLSDIKDMLENHPIEDMIAFSELQNTVGFGNSIDKKQYVRVATLDEYINNYNDLQKESSFNLWPDALLVTDGFRYFSQSEIDTLYNIKKISRKNKPENRYKIHLKKMIKNGEYRYYFKRVIQVVLYKIKTKFA